MTAAAPAVHADLVFVTETQSAVDLVAAVREGDLDAARDVLTAKSEAQLWALVLDLAAMVTDESPDPERVLEYCCSTETRLTYSRQPGSWPIEDLQDALMVHRARLEPGARWVARGVQEWRRRHVERQRAIDEANRQALQLRARTARDRERVAS